MSRDKALDILITQYGHLENPNFIAVENGELKITDQQAVAKLDHADLFGINVADFNFSRKQTQEINNKGGLRAYVQRGGTLPSFDLIRAYQNALKTFCENRELSSRNNEATARGKPVIVFSNKDTRQIVIFDAATKEFISAYRIDRDRFDQYQITFRIQE